MNHTQALKAIGVSVAKENAMAGATTLYVRATNNALWRNAMQNLILGTSLDKGWTVDVSKYFYADKGVVKYLWRIVIRSADMQGALDFLGACALAARPRVELDSYPLVGRSQQTVNVAAGKTRGAHGPVGGDGGDAASGVLASHFIPTGGG